MRIISRVRLKPSSWAGRLWRSYHPAWDSSVSSMEMVSSPSRGPVLAALRLVDGDRPRRFQLTQQFGGIVHNTSVKGHGDTACVHLGDHTDIAVENAQITLTCFGIFPKQIVVVADLHDTVALSEDVLPEGPFALVGGRRIEGGLQGAVEGGGACPTHTGGGEHLDLVGRDAHVFGQTGQT